jgi:hypothetical protein
MARKKKLGWRQKLREQPVIAARLVGAVVSLLVAEFALPVSEPMTDLIQLVILGYLLGPGALETVYQWRKVVPVAKTERLEEEGPQVNPELYRR